MATFKSYNFHRYHAAYLLLCLVFPALTAAFFALLGRLRPRQRGSADLGAILPLHSSLEEESTEVVDQPATLRFPRLLSTLRMIIVGAVLAVELSISQQGSMRLPVWSVLVVITYTAAVVAVAGMVRRQRRGATLAGRISEVNSLFTVAVLPGLLLVSQGTTMYVRSQHRFVHFEWFPLWLAITLTTVVLIAWLVMRRRCSLLVLERGMLTWLIGPVAVFLLTARIAGSHGRSLAYWISGGSFQGFWGFDDAHWLVVPNFVIHHHMFPWRDFYTTHGLYQDLITGVIGLPIFGWSWWGGLASMGMLFVPLYWIAVYCFFAHFARSNRLLLVPLVILMTTGLMSASFMAFSVRFTFVPILFILFDQLLKRASWPRASLFSAVLLASMILTPEMVIMGGCIVATLILFELAAGWRNGLRGLLPSMPRVAKVVASTLILSACWVVYLAMNHALGGFVDFFGDNAAGRSYAVAIPRRHWAIGSDYLIETMVVLPVVLWWATFARSINLLRRRTPWTRRDVAMAAAGLIAFAFLTKVVDIPDPVHIVEYFAASTPLVGLWAITLIERADRRLWDRRLHEEKTWRKWAAVPSVTAAVTVAVAFFACIMSDQIGQAIVGPNLVSAVAKAPSRFHAQNPTPANGRFGYFTPNEAQKKYLDVIPMLIDRYAPAGEPVLDFADAPGVSHFILDRRPGSRFYMQETSQTFASQTRQIAELRQSRPAMVIMDSSAFGYSKIDGVPASVRSWLVARYVFTHYSPLVNVNGNYLWLRNDLLANAPPLPPLPRQAKVSTPWLGGNACTLGDIPNHFTPPSRSELTGSLQIPSTVLSVPTGPASGWISSPTSPFMRVVMTDATGRVLASAPPGGSRPDITKKLPDMRVARGFTVTVPSGLKGRVSYWGLTKDGQARMLGPSPGVLGISTDYSVSTLNFRGRSYETKYLLNSGEVESNGASPNSLRELALPAAATASKHPWIRISSSKPIGESWFILSDKRKSPNGHTISFHSLPSTGRELTVLVDACQQWWGYPRSKPLYLSAYGFPAGQSLRVSALAGSLKPG